MRLQAADRRERPPPSRRIGTGSFRLSTIDLAPDAAHETKAITADAARGSAVAVGRADPAFRLCQNSVCNIHGTSALPSYSLSELT